MSKRMHPRYTITFVTLLIVWPATACQMSPASFEPATSELSGSAWPVASELDPDRVFGEAETLITRYLATTDAITRDGGDGPTRMVGVVTESWFPREDAAFAHYQEQRLRTVGHTTVDSLVIQSVSQSVTGNLHVEAIACVDATGVWLLSHDAPDPPEGLVEWWGGGHQGQEMSETEFDEWSEYLEDAEPLSGEREAIVLWLVGQDLTSLAIDGTVNWEGAHSCHTPLND